MKKFWFIVLLSAIVFALPWFGYDLDDEFDLSTDFESYDDRPSYVPWEYIIKYNTSSNTRKGGNTISVESVESDLQSSLDDDQEFSVIDTIPNFNMAVVSIQWDQDAQDVIDALKRNDNIKYAQPNYIYYIESIDTNDPSVDLLWWLDNQWQIVNDVEWTPGEDIDWVKAWNTFSSSLSSSGPGSVVWVIDMWINYNHEDLKDQMRTNWNWFHWYDFVHNDNDPMPGGIDSHWTHVAGTIAAKINNWKWIVWVNPNVKIASLMAWEGGHLDTDDIISAIDYAIDNWIKIINASYWWYNPDPSAYEAYTRFRNSWWILVASAWNKGIDTDETLHYPSGYELDNIISVGATDSNWNMRYNYWKHSVDVWSPWISIYSASVNLSNNPSYYMDFKWLSFDELENIWFNFYPSKEYFGHTSTANNFRFYSDLTPNWAYIESPNIDISDFYWMNLYIGVANTCGNTSSEDSDWLWLEIDTWAGYSEIKRFWEGTFNTTFNAWYNESDNMKYRFVFHRNENPTQFSCWLRIIMIPWLTGWPNDYYSLKNWTSMASPHVSWLASLVWMFRPDLTAQQVIQAIMENWDPLPSLETTTVSGKRINAYNTLAALDNYAPSTPTLTSPTNETIFKDYTSPAFQRTESTDRWVWVDYYVFQLATSSTFEPSSLITKIQTETNQVNYSISNINPTWTYYWRVWAVDIMWNEWDSSEASFSYYIVPPVINVTGPESWWKKSKTVSASVTDTEVDTAMWYAISDTNVCQSQSYSQSYTKWSSIQLDNESYNDKYICFKAESNWWISYAASAKIEKIDTTAPTDWDFSINNGASYTNNTSVTLNTTCPSDAWIWEIKVAYGTSPNPTNWTDCSVSIAFNLSAPDWTKTVYMRFRDWLENATDDISKSIILDTTAPILNFSDDVSASYAKSDTVTVDWWDATVKKYMYTTNSTCSVNENDYTDTTNTSFNQTTEDNNGKYICLFAKDSLWNPSTKRSASTIHIDKTAPTGWSFTINNNASYTKSASVTLNTTCATDSLAWNVQVAYGASPNPTNWTTCSANLALDLPAPDWTKTVYMRFKDWADNTTDDISKSIILDTTAPVLNFSDDISASYVKSDTVTVDWWDATVKKYMYTTENTCPATPVNLYIDTTLTDFSQTSQDNNGKYICLYAEDSLWNVSTKISKNAIHIDTTPPTGWSFVINNDATYTNNTSVTLNTTCATDSLAWNVQVAYGTSPNPTNWTDCSANLALDLSTPDWTKLVYMRFKDWADNTTSDISKSIILDTSAPVISADNYWTWGTSDFNITLTLSIGDNNGLNYSKYSRTSAEDCITDWIAFTNWTILPYNNEWTSTLYLCVEDKAWNTNTWNWTYKLDKTIPAVSFNNQNWAIAKSHSIVVTVNDSTSKLAANQKIKYKWSASETCWTDWFTEIALTPATADTASATATISTDWLSDGSYYLCILWWTVSDQAGNKNVAANTSWVFEIDNTPPSLEIQYSAMNVCTNSDIIVGITSSDSSSWIPDNWYSWNSTSDRWNITEITLTENWNWIVYVKDNVWNFAWTEYNVDWIDKTAPTLESVNVTWPECTLLEWGVTVNDTLCWANNIVFNWTEFWEWTTTATLPYKLMWIWTKTWIIKAIDWAWNESSSVEVTYTWTDTEPTLESPNYGHNTTITTTKAAKIWNVVQLLWAIDWDCWNWSEYINATNVSCTKWSWKLENNELFVYAPSGSEWVSICSITFVDDEGNSIVWNLAYNYSTKSTWWSGWGGWGWGWWWWGWGGWSSSSNSNEKSWIEKAIEIKNMIHEDDPMKWDSSTDSTTEKSDLANDNSVEDLSHNVADSDSSQKNDVSNMGDDWVSIKANGKDFWYMTWNQWELMPNWFSKELNNAYVFSYTNWVTTMNSIYSANMNWLLSRIAMAKMLSIYAINVLGKSPNTSRVPNFNDVSDKLDKDYNNWVTLAYQLWIMWQNMPNNFFRPYDLVTRAEFATALSRLLYWTKDWSDFYYSTHLQKLRNEWIISNTDPRMHEVRWYVMLMLMRSSIK